MRESTPSSATRESGGWNTQQTTTDTLSNVTHSSITPPPALDLSLERPALLQHEHRNPHAALSARTRSNGRSRHFPFSSPTTLKTSSWLRNIQLILALQVLALCPVFPQRPHVTVLLGLFSADDWIRFCFGLPRLFVSMGGARPSSISSFKSTVITIPS